MVDAATRNEDWLRTLSWDLPKNPAAFTPGQLEKLAKLPAGEAMPPELRAHLTAAGDWDESKHPRNAKGEFDDGTGGETTKAEKPIKLRGGDHHEKVKDALAKLPPNTPVAVAGFKAADGYKMDDAVAMRNENGLTIVAEVDTRAEGVDMRDRAELERIAGNRMDTVEAAHGGVIAAFDGDPDAALAVQSMYVMANGPNPRDAVLSETYGRRFSSEASADGRGNATWWKGYAPQPATAMHEAGHQVDTMLFKPSDQEWWQAQRQDRLENLKYQQEHGPSYVRDAVQPSHEAMLSEDGVTTYGRTNNSEDFAESFRLYSEEKLGADLRVVMGDGARPTFSEVYPNRKAMLDVAVEHIKGLAHGENLKTTKLG